MIILSPKYINILIFNFKFIMIENGTMVSMMDLKYLVEQENHIHFQHYPSTQNFGLLNQVNVE